MHIKDEDLAGALSEQLGETCAAAAYARVTTALSPARMLTPLGNYLIARPAARSAAKKVTEATDVPLDAAMAVGITGDELHVWRADPMLNQVHEHLGSVALSRIKSIQVNAGRTWQDVVITLDDGNDVKIQARGAVHAIASEFDRRAEGS